MDHTYQSKQVGGFYFLSVLQNESRTVDIHFDMLPYVNDVHVACITENVSLHIYSSLLHGFSQKELKVQVVL